MSAHNTVQALRGGPGASDKIAASYHEETVAAFLAGLDDEGKRAFERGVTQRRQNFLRHAESLYIDALDSVSVVERMDNLRKIIAVFEPDPQATTDDAVLDVQVKTVNSILDMLEQEDLPKAQALCLRALISLYPKPPKVEPPPKKEKAKPKNMHPKRAAPARRGAQTRTSEPISTHPSIVERSTAPMLTAVLNIGLKLVRPDAVWYVRIWALRLVSRIAPWTIILGLASRKEEPNAESCFADIAKLINEERNDHLRNALIQTVFDMQVFAHLAPKARGLIMVSLTDRMMVDPDINTRFLILKRLGPMVNTDQYASQPCDKEALQTILCMFHDESVKMRCLAMETLVKIVPKKDDQSILNEIVDQIRDLENKAYIRRRLSAAKSILPSLGMQVPPEMLLPSPAPVAAPQNDEQASECQPAKPMNLGRELSVLVLAALTSQGNKQVMHDTIRLLGDDDHFVRLAAARVLAHVAPDDAAVVTLILKFIEGVSAEERKKMLARQAASIQGLRPRNSSKMMGGSSRNLPAQQKHMNTIAQQDGEQAEEPAEKGRDCLQLLAGVYALQLVVGRGPGRDQLLKEVPRLFSHYDAAVRQAVVETMQVTCGSSQSVDGDCEGTRQAIRVTLPMLESACWEAREVALQVIAGLAGGTEKECVAPLVATLSDDSWIVRYQAVITIVQFFERCPDQDALRPLIKAVIFPGSREHDLDGPEDLLKRHEGEPFALALDALRIISERDDDLRGAIGKHLNDELCLTPGTVQCPNGACEGTWLLNLPVSSGVAILLESKKAQRDALRCARSDVADLKNLDSGDIFSKAFCKFKEAADAEVFPTNHCDSNKDPIDQPLLSTEPSSISGEQAELGSATQVVLDNPSAGAVERVFESSALSAGAGTELHDPSTTLTKPEHAEATLGQSIPDPSSSNEAVRTDDIGATFDLALQAEASGSETKSNVSPKIACLPALSWLPHSESCFRPKT